MPDLVQATINNNADLLSKQRLGCVKEASLSVGACLALL